MLPRDFLSTYGRVSRRRLGALAVGDQVCDANPDRYLLWIVATNPIDIGIGPAGGEQVHFQTIASGSNPIVLTHALHGALVAEPFMALDPAAAGVVTVVEGTMRPHRRLGRSDNA